MLESERISCISESGKGRREGEGLKKEKDKRKGEKSYRGYEFLTVIL